MLDDIDRAILRTLQQNSRLTVEALGDLVGTSRASAQRRVQALRKSGAIATEIAVIDPRVVGAQMTFVVEVTLERERVDLLDEFRRSMAALEEVQQCYYVTGHADFVLIVLAKDMPSYESFTRRVFTENPNIRRFHTNVVVDRVKVGLAVPI